MRNKKLFMPLLTLCPLMMAGVGPEKVKSAVAPYQAIQISNFESLGLEDDGYKYSFRVTNTGQDCCFFANNQFSFANYNGNYNDSWNTFYSVSMTSRLFNEQMIRPGDFEEIECYYSGVLTIDDIKGLSANKYGNPVYEYTFENPKITKTAYKTYKLGGSFKYASGYSAKKSLEHPYQDNCSIQVDVTYKNAQYTFIVNSETFEIHTQEDLDLDELSIDSTRLYYRTSTSNPNTTRKNLLAGFFENLFGFIAIIVLIPVFLSVGIIVLVSVYKKRHEGREDPDNQF